MKLESIFVKNVRLITQPVRSKIMGKWYNEYNGHWRIHDYFSIMVNQFPIVVVRKMDNPHSENDDMNKIIMIGMFGFTKVITKKATK